MIAPQYGHHMSIRFMTRYAFSHRPAPDRPRQANLPTMRLGLGWVGRDRFPRAEGSLTVFLGQSVMPIA